MTFVGLDVRALAGEEPACGKQAPTRAWDVVCRTDQTSASWTPMVITSQLPREVSSLPENENNLRCETVA